ncbi:29761_t:CDS:1, partial [Gigaspora margarita]
QQQKITATNHASEVSVRSIEQATTLKIHNANNWIKPYDKARYRVLENGLQKLQPWKPLNLEEFLPSEP